MYIIICKNEAKLFNLITQQTGFKKAKNIDLDCFNYLKNNDAIMLELKK